MKINISPDWDAIKEMLQGKLANMFVLRNLCICLGISFTMLLSGYVNPAHLFLEEVQAATGFNDDASIRDYSREAVESLVETGGIKGYPEDNTFRAQGTITRLEFLSMCINACGGSAAVEQAVKDAKNNIENGLSLYDDIVQTDNIANLWSGKGTDLIVGAMCLNIMCPLKDNGSGKNVWQQPILRYEAADIMADCLENLKGEKLPVNFNDYDLSTIIGDWEYNEQDYNNDKAKGYTYENVWGCQTAYSVAQLYLIGILHGDSEAKFHPDYNLTREDSAVMIYALANPSKRDTSKIKAIEKVDPYAGVEISTLYETDGSRRDAVPGDTFVTASGESVVVKEGTAGVLGEGQPIGLDLGRVQTNNGIKDETIANGVSSDGTFYRLGARYLTNPATGESHWSDEWDKIEEAYMPTESGSYDGEVRTFGLGGWCTYTYRAELDGWQCSAKNCTFRF